MLMSAVESKSNDQLIVPPLAKALMDKISLTLGVDRICIAGGFLRGLYMQQNLGLKPQMKDIDIFADISVEDFAKLKESLQKELGIPIRYHVGQFETEEQQRGLIEFTLPEDLSKACGGVKSVQLNFGLSHPWADAREYIRLANVGINQVSMDKSGEVFMSDTFLSDMQNRTMTMNSDRDWSIHDWNRTRESMRRMRAERPEFKDWSEVLANKPLKPITGSFWESYRSSQRQGGQRTI